MTTEKPVCKWCGTTQLISIGMHECSSCQELHRAIAGNPQMAIKILKNVVKNIIITVKK